MKLIKQLLPPTLTLLIIGTVVTAVLSVTNLITKDRIAAQNEEKLAAAMTQLVPNGTFDLTYEDDTLFCYQVTVTGKPAGTIVRSSAMGYKSMVEVLTAFDTQNKVTGVAVTHCADESPGIGQKVGTDQVFLDQYKGYEANQKIDAITGATYSSDAVTAAVEQAVAYVQGGAAK